MKKVLLLLVVLALAGCITEPIDETGLVTADVVEVVNVVVSIDNGDTLIFSDVPVPAGSTAFEVFDIAADLEYSTHPTYGIFIIGVNGLSQDDTHYWQYYVDGELAPVGVDAFIIDQDMALEFRYEIPPEFV